FSIQALERLKSRGMTPRGLAVYARDCAREAAGHLAVRRRLAAAVALCAGATCALTVLAASPLYAEEPTGFTQFALATVAGTVLTLALTLASIGLFRDRAGEPHHALRWANRLTIIRFVLVLPPAVLTVHGHPLAALGVYVFSMLTDVLDGVVARRRQEQTEFGAVMDPLADVLATIAIYGAFLFDGLIPTWVFAMLIVRYAVLIIGVAVVFLTAGPMRLQATPVGKVVAVLQALVAILILAIAARHAQIGPEVASALYGFLGVIFGVVIVSQVVIGWRHVRGTLSE
ncbi:MAG: CDP-alcohol phosphatidyltransferase family protein, partial [Gemmatimonadetes bacterium]|nr:CDP-alcohol phosphatidyltransferase family protein [Gemmatimonadota bacterium]